MDSHIYVSRHQCGASDFVEGDLCLCCCWSGAGWTSGGWYHSCGGFWWVGGIENRQG